MVAPRSRQKPFGGPVWVRVLPAWVLASAAIGAGEPPHRFRALFDGTSLDAFKTSETTSEHWRIEEGILRYDGKGGDLWTRDSFRDFVLRVDWRFPEPGARREVPVILPSGEIARDPEGEAQRVEIQYGGDSGIYLRGSSKSQVNIWNWPIGSGEVWGYRTDSAMPPEVRAAATPRVRADRPLGEWNTFTIILRGDRLSVDLNGARVIPEARLPGTPEEGPIALQNHGDPIDFREIHVRELPAGLVDLSGGADLSGWKVVGASEAVELTYALDLGRVLRDRSGVAEETLDILRQRLRAYGLRSTELETPQEDRILVRLPRIDEETLFVAKKMIDFSGRLSFQLVASEERQTDKNLERYEQIEREYIQADRAWVQRRLADPTSDAPRPRPPDYIVRSEVERRALAGRDEYVSKPGSRRLLENFHEDYDAERSEWTPRGIVGGRHLVRVSETLDPAYLKPAISFELDDEGAAAFGELTASSIGRKLSIVLDDAILQTATIQSKITERGQLTGDFTQEEVRSIVTVLKSGSLPVKPELLAESRVGTWTARDGLLVCTGEPRGFIRTKSDHEDYVLEGEWRFPGTPGQTGLLLHAREPDRVWPPSIEVQLDHGSVGNFIAIGDVSFKGGRRTSDRERPPGEWNRFEVACRGDTIEVFINGEKVSEARECSPRRGSIGLQSEGVEVHFRNLWLRPE